MPAAIQKEDLIRIKVIELPKYRVKGEGLYEWRDIHNKFLVNMLDLEKEIEQVLPGKGIDLLDRLQNFRKIFINRRTKEVMT